MPSPAGSFGRKIVEKIRSLDGLLARAESALLVLLLFSLAAGGLAQVFLQKIPLSSHPSLVRVLGGIAVGLGLIGAVLARRGQWAGPLALGVLTGLLAVSCALGAALDPIQRALVLWIGIVGAGLAVRREEHITIEALSRFLPDSLVRTARATWIVAALVVVGFLFAYALRYVHDTHRAGEVYVTLLRSGTSIPASIVKGILPVGMAILFWRFALQMIRTLVLPLEDLRSSASPGTGATER